MTMNCTHPIENEIPFIKSKSDWIGEKVGGYLIENHIASGSSGSVYQAKGEDGPVAIKILTMIYPTDILRFEREIKSLVSISHPNIVTLLGGGDIDDQYCFLVMELFKAKDLNHFLTIKENFSTLETILIIKQSLQALAAIHRKNYVHRDLKPANILYNRSQQQLKIIDFGIVKKKHDETFTAKGSLLGTPLFMSPEQCLGAEVDYRSDIYSLGIIFYCLLTGEHPFERKSVIDTLTAHINSPLKWSPSSDKVPVEIKSVVEKMVKKVPGNRYQSAEEIKEILEEIEIVEKRKEQEIRIKMQRKNYALGLVKKPE